MFRIIIYSQPKCNNLLILGCALCMLSVLLMGLPAGKSLIVMQHLFPLLCHVNI